MKDNKLLVLTEASKSIGLGHINRVNNLLTIFRENRIDISWYIKGDEIINLDLEDKVSYINWDSDEYLVNFKTFDLIIIDTYLVQKDFLDKIVSHNNKILFIIDNNLSYVDSEFNNNIFVLFSSAYAKKEMVSDKVKFIGGIDYLLFNDYFYDAVISDRKLNNQINKIVINIGGFYDLFFVNQILKRIDEIYSNVQITILGKPKEINSSVFKMKHGNNAEFNFCNKIDYVNVLNNSDLIITNGGQSLNEAIFLRKPSIVITFAENQLKNAKFWNDLKLVRYIGNIDDLILMDKLGTELERIKCIKEREVQVNLNQVKFQKDIKKKIFNVFLEKKK